MDFKEQLIGHVWEVLDDERRVQKLTQGDMAKRLQDRLQNFVRSRSRQVDMQLSTLAKYAHAMGKRVVITLVDEIKE